MRYILINHNDLKILWKIIYNMNNNVLTIKTVQIAPFRTLMTALKDILLETNITFQKDGIKLSIWISLIRF